MKSNSTLKLSMCERPRVAVHREVRNALDVYLLEDTFSEVELYINFTNNRIIDLVEKDCIKKGISLKKFYRGGDGQYHLPRN